MIFQLYEKTFVAEKLLIFLHFIDTNVRHTNYGKIKQPLKAPTVYKQTDEALICLTKKKVQLPLRADST